MSYAPRFRQSYTARQQQKARERRVQAIANNLQMRNKGMSRAAALSIAVKAVRP